MNTYTFLHTRVSGNQRIRLSSEETSVPNNFNTKQSGIYFHLPDNSRVKLSTHGSMFRGRSRQRLDNFRRVRLEIEADDTAAISRRLLERPKQVANHATLIETRKRRGRGRRATLSIPRRGGRSRPTRAIPADRGALFFFGFPSNYRAPARGASGHARAVYEAV